MEFPEGYLEDLADELAPYGFEFSAVTTAEEGGSDILFETEPESFLQAYPDCGIDESYGSGWPPECLDLWLRFDPGGDPVEISFEIFDLLAWSASSDTELNARLNVLDDPEDHAMAVGEALARLLASPLAEDPDYL